MNLSIILKGMAMGIAEAIPGVSGGTIAFITGIYERLLEAIGGILGPKVIGSLRKDGVASAYQAADGGFILQLGIGMVIGLGIAVASITKLLDSFPPVVWGFFFGLIISSAIYVARQVEKWNVTTIVLLLLGAVVAYFLTTINPMAESDNLVFVFIAGMIAISALILPGISGSFILLLLGMYTVVFQAVKNMASGDSGALLIVVVFGFGCLVGLALFSRVLSYTFKTFPNQTLALLTGFMLGSLNKLWPWRNALTFRTNSAGEQVALLEAPAMPNAYVKMVDGNILAQEPYILGVIVAFVAGLAIVFALDRFAPPKEEQTVGNRE
ncbi:MAG: putative membrane protein [Neolewinella sp.]|jgi:putative membrane protein